jgi:hypothetical protein
MPKLSALFLSKGGSHRPAFKETRAELLSFRGVFGDPLLDTVGDVLVIALEHHGMAVAFLASLNLRPTYPREQKLVAKLGGSQKCKQTYKARIAFWY